MSERLSEDALALIMKRADDTEAAYPTTARAMRLAVAELRERRAADLTADIKRAVDLAKEVDIAVDLAKELVVKGLPSYTDDVDTLARALLAVMPVVEAAQAHRAEYPEQYMADLNEGACGGTREHLFDAVDALRGAEP